MKLKVCFTISRLKVRRKYQLMLKKMSVFWLKYANRPTNWLQISADMFLYEPDYIRHSARSGSVWVALIVKKIVLFLLIFYVLIVC